MEETDGTTVIAGSGRLLSQVIEDICRELKIKRVTLAPEAGLSARTVDRVLGGDYDRIPIDPTTGQAKPRKIDKTLDTLEEFFRRRGIEQDLLDEIRVAAHRTPERRTLSPGHSRAQSVGSLLKSYRGSQSQEALARRAFPEVPQSNIAAAVAIVDQVEEMRTGDYPPPAHVRALIQGLDNSRRLDARGIQTMATSYLWLQDLVDLRAPRTVIALIVSSTVHNVFWAEFVTACLAFATDHTTPYWIVPCHHEEKIRLQMQHLEALWSLDLAGVIIVPARSYTHYASYDEDTLDWIEKARDRSIPVVVVDHPLPGGRALPYIAPDHERIGRMAAHAILGRGHRRIGVLLDVASGPHVLRKQGFEHAAAAFARTHDESVDIVTASGVDIPAPKTARDPISRGLKEEARSLLTRRPPSTAPTAVFCGSSEAALALLAALDVRQERTDSHSGLGAPRRTPVRRPLSIVAGDDVPILAAAHIDAIAYRANVLAERAMTMVIRLIDEPGRIPAPRGADDLSASFTETLEIERIKRGSLRTIGKTRKRDGPPLTVEPVVDSSTRIFDHASDQGPRAV